MLPGARRGPSGVCRKTASGKNGIGGAKRVDMADVANRYPQNVAGRFYVDDQCIDCDLCRETASANFTRDDDGGHTYVLKQPETPEEEALCKEAMEGCPVEAIGNDGAIILAPLPAFFLGASFPFP